ncbi:30S ribosomal protein S8 [Candidatus Kaiserbacteria bacterium RIFCSPHIGHO2_12_FULL_56_13]|uniref:Small ribosomal subunit protein uS8 n=2 Tax=Candidatus Kaiseribacteriota TaxID=1752734 RepID=A0A1F6E2C7_9BACT|nr:MAG: 30S ribosomal protein S8 [Candidatus Kaiserbacteria bacterium RIFCSPHIGHO2_02_FULL_56_30]OGG72422.1 MAG: 30S ribosomal protein S8 [Candidatus Kaiserbacteria bacterium RIFCSPHIGHO2_12_FULL_56_13]
MSTDRVGDFIVRLKNATAAEKSAVSLPHSTYLEAIAKKLHELGFVAAVSVEGDAKKTLTVALARDEAGRPKIRGVRRLSKPGRRLYLAHHEAHEVKEGLGARILSTPSGIVSDTEARKARLGGEDLFEIW